MVLDLGQKGQHGVTQRFFESLSSGCRVISSSKDLNRLNIPHSRCLSLSDFIAGDWFLPHKDSDLIEIQKALNEYHIDNWVNKLVEG